METAIEREKQKIAHTKSSIRGVLHFSKRGDIIHGCRYAALKASPTRRANRCSPMERERKMGEMEKKRQKVTKSLS